MGARTIGRLLILIAGCILTLTFAWLAFRPMPPAPAHYPPPPTPSPGSRQGFRVLMVLVDGAGKELLQAAGLDELVPPVLTIDLEGHSDPAVALNSIALGLSPEKISALSGGEELPEPFWRTAMRRGLRAAVLFWPDVYPDSPSRADCTVAPVSCYGPASLQTITFTGAINPPLEGTLEIRAPEGGITARLRVLAPDTTDDGKVNYDAVALEGGREPLHPGEWLPLEVDHNLHSGAFFKLVEIKPDGKKAILYHTPLCYNYAMPPSLLRELNGNVGFPPPLPDPQSIAQGWLGPGDMLLFAEKRARWISEATATAWRECRPDLLLARFDLLSETAGSNSLPQVHGLMAESLRRLAEGIGEDALLVVLSPEPEGFLAIYGRSAGKVESSTPLRTEDIATLILSLLLP